MSTDDPRFGAGYQDPPPLIDPRVPCLKCRARIYRDAKRCHFCGSLQLREKA